MKFRIEYGDPADPNIVIEGDRADMTQTGPDGARRLTVMEGEEPVFEVWVGPDHVLAYEVVEED